MDLLLEHLGKGLFNIILLSMPIVLTAAGIGLIVGILQAVTQVQEQTIAAAPKILGVFLVLLMGGTIILNVLNTYFIDAISLATEIIPKDGYFAAAPLNMPDPDKKTREFFNDDRFKRKKENREFSDILNKPLDSPYLKAKEQKEPTTYTPAPPIPDANISEEIKNYKDMMDQNKNNREKPAILQKDPTIPPLTKPQTNPTISILPSLDEPPSINPSDLESLPKIALEDSPSNDSVTGAAAYLTPNGHYKFDYNVKGSTIIINNDDVITYNKQNSHQSKKKGSIILETE